MFFQFFIESPEQNVQISPGFSFNLFRIKALPEFSAESDATKIYFRVSIIAGEGVRGSVNYRHCYRDAKFAVLGREIILFLVYPCTRRIRTNYKQESYESNSKTTSLFHTNGKRHAIRMNFCVKIDTSNELGKMNRRAVTHPPVSLNLGLYNRVQHFSWFKVSPLQRINKLQPAVQHQLKASCYC